MRKAAEEEIRLAKERGDVNNEGVPLLTVVADGSWAKRSYRRNYNSLSGMAAIVGYHTRQVLYFGVKNKYCLTCTRKPGDTHHKCFKNWNGSSSSMEAATIVEGFLASEEMYNVQYARMIADGDSSVYNSIVEARPYQNLTVKKIECRNHMLRNYCNKLKDVVTTSLHKDLSKEDRGLHLKMRRVLGGRIMRLRTAVTKAIQHRKVEEGEINEKAEKLRLDIVNGPSHVFGEHLHCKSRGYFCNGPKENETNYIPEMKASGVLYKIMEAVNVLADHSSHLIYDVDSNMVEHYNAVVARFTGGKRINYIQKGSYRMGCAAAVVSHNTNQPFYKLHKTMYKSSPGLYAKQFEARHMASLAKRAERNRLKPRIRRCLNFTSKVGDSNYGPMAKKPDRRMICTRENYRNTCRLFRRQCMKFKKSNKIQE
ncbi:uncharacterized protein LOC120356095, partial [Nilaparvata lugens]|uniref:uncharacterized protein LOC120356095 n=1 Tax=Nilaparvata lugens TaxID=108931 RepID=UPI00193CEF8D